METFNQIFDISLVIRVLSSVLLGFAIGLEREMTNKYAGLRTNILVCLGACLFTIISIYGFPEVSVTGDELGTRDTARVAAQVVTGIGFIGGGTVLRHGATVFGLTTAATLWVSASIGMACGAGMYGLAITATVLSILVLVSVRLFEKNVLVSSTKNTRRLKMSISCLNENSNAIYDYIIENSKHLREISRKLNKQDDNLTKIVVILDFVGRHPIQDLYKNYQKLEGIESISIQEFNE
ncbi:MAG TPA: MgtC/SapB family protein [Candidatus Stercorousia faecigallinarum]|nr:MgtC/SapB family protein [Candidatus Stercorousia faecigallinarum]